MADADSLRRTSLSGLESLAGTDKQAYADALYQRMVEDIERRSADDMRSVNENLFSRGLGLSTYLSDQQKKMEQARADAIIRARREADLAAQSATLQALGQAAGAAQTDLSRQQSAQNADANRQMQAKALDRQEGIANRQMLVGGLGSLGAAGLYGAAKSGAFKGLGSSIAEGVRGLLTPGDQPLAANLTGLDAQRAGEWDLTPFGSGMASPSTSDFDMPDFGGGIDYGLGSLSDPVSSELFLPQIDFGGFDGLSGLDLLSFGVGDWDWTNSLSGWEGW